MVDRSGQAEIRGIDIDKLAKGFADEEIIMKRFVTVTPTSAREIRWYKKIAGVLSTVDSTGITANKIANMPELALPHVVEAGWTRQTSYVRKYFVESPTLGGTRSGHGAGVQQPGSNGSHGEDVRRFTRGRRSCDAYGDGGVLIRERSVP